MFKKIWELIKRHKILFVFCFIAFVVFIVMLVIFLKMTINTSSKYGTRLDGIEEVEISKSTFKEVKSMLEEKEEVSSAKVRLQGKIIYVDIIFNDTVKLDKGKEIAGSVLEKFSEEELNFYDFSFIINQVSDKEDAETWSSAGARKAMAEKISWTRS